jgi:hypothetical protein
VADNSSKINNRIDLRVLSSGNLLQIAVVDNASLTLIIVELGNVCLLVLLSITSSKTVHSLLEFSLVCLANYHKNRSNVSGLCKNFLSRLVANLI